MFGLLTFASRVPATFVRKGMIKYLLSVVDPSGEKAKEDEGPFAAVKSLRRKPDAVAVLDDDCSANLGLPRCRHLLFVEVEYSAPITSSALIEYSELYDISEEEEFSVALAVVDHYGSHRFVDLGGVFIASIAMAADPQNSKESFDAFTLRSQMGA
jgi:hypothetical protein